MSVVLASLLVLISGAALSPSAGPPVLNSPTYSLATLNADGSTNMNIVTYATPVGIRPVRKWIVSLFRSTKSYENLVARRRGVLALLTEEHAELVRTLGGTTGDHKARTCAESGLAWVGSETFDEQLLPRCISYVDLELDSSDATPADAGDHEVFLCRVKGFYDAADGADSPGGLFPMLMTQDLRDRGIITPAGKAVPLLEEGGE